VRITNEGPESSGEDSLAELLRLQAEFQAHLAEETLRYLRAVQATLAPRSPGTVVQPAPDARLEATAAPSEDVRLSFDLENRQRVHSQATPALTPLVADTGATWFPAARPDPVSTLVPPGEVVAFTIDVAVPADVPPGTYRGTLVLQGFRQDGLPVVITVVAPEAAS
jgi:hypothetical protein